jgi:hypothetical protein
MNLSTTAVDWSTFKPVLKCDDLTRIYPYTLRTIRNMAAQMNPKIPTPCGSRPFIFRKDDVMRHFNRLEA